MMKRLLAVGVGGSGGAAVQWDCGCLWRARWACAERHHTETCDSCWHQAVLHGARKHCGVHDVLCASLCWLCAGLLGLTRAVLRDCRAVTGGGCVCS
jgi:hypothetical protein